MNKAYRDYHNNYYKTHPKRKADVRRYKANAIKRNKKFVSAYLSSHPCLVCNESDIVVLEFDHREADKKLMEVSLMVQRAVSIKRLETEMLKCDVLCANCHRRKTAATLWGA